MTKRDTELAISILKGASKRLDSTLPPGWKRSPRLLLARALRYVETQQFYPGPEGPKSYPRLRPTRSRLAPGEHYLRLRTSSIWVMVPAKTIRPIRWKNSF